MTVLILDTVSSLCRVAVAEGGTLLASSCVDIGKGHAERLLADIEKTLKEAASSIDALKKIIVHSGPGSFTGVRVGFACAEGLSLGLEIPVVPISLFEALAYEAALWLKQITPSGCREPTSLMRREALLQKASPKEICVLVKDSLGTYRIQSFDRTGKKLGPVEIKTKQEMQEMCRQARREDQAPLFVGEDAAGFQHLVDQEDTFTALCAGAFNQHKAAPFPRLETFLKLGMHKSTQEQLNWDEVFPAYPAAKKTDCTQDP